MDESEEAATRAEITNPLVFSERGRGCRSSRVYITGAAQHQQQANVNEETDASESMEAEATVDVGDQKLVPVSPPGLSEHGDEDNFVASEKEMENKETEHKETKAAAAPSPASSPSPSQSSVSTNETSRTVLVRGAEPGSTSESGQEAAEVKPEDEFEINEHGDVVRDDGLEQSTAGPDVKEDTDMDETSDFKEETTNTDIDSKEVIDTQQQQEEEEESHVCKPKVSTADDLDEMMDIGTVDQSEQEAQMKEEEQQNSLESSRSPWTSTTVSVAEEDEETDVKPTILPPPPPVEEQAEDVKVSLDTMQCSSSPSSVATVSTERDSSSPAMNGMKVVKLPLPRVTTEANPSTQSSPSPPLVKVKDEPVDEEYDQALVSSTASVKDEPDTAMEDLRIESVFSVTPTVEAKKLPTVYPSSAHMSCSYCKKSLMKGQTAFQRKGSPALFCSTACLTVSLSALRGATKICCHCQKVILRPQDVILAPDEKGAMKEFCSQNCLTSFNYKKNPSSYRKTDAAAAKQPPLHGPPSLCSMCTRYCISKHEVILSGAVHKMCSDACFNRFRTLNNLSMACCADCGSYCHTKPLMLKTEDGSKTVCNSECLAKYKEKSKIHQPCLMCRTTRLLAETIDNRNSDDSVNFFCSSSCVMAFKVQTVSASGARLDCDSCGKNTVPAYHLAMSDTSIRNFCTLPCVMVFQEKFKKSQKQVNVFTKLPIGSTQIQQVAPPAPQQDVGRGPLKLDCSQCNRSITFKPELVQIQDKVVFLCSVDCAHEFKKANYVTSLCEYCKIEKITRDAKRIDNKDCYFCSDGCKLLFRHDLTKNWGKHCHSCVYCHCVSKKLVTAQYGGTTEEFCSEDCRSKYTMLFCHISVQTDTIKAPPPPAPKILKNKALLCRPLVQNKGVSCKAQTADAEVQTDDAFPKMMILPVPVPVYVPVPMNMYSQCTPRPVGLPVPLPVPMFLPVTMNSAERIVETIQEIKAKIPSDPFEAELILMAEMVAEQDEKNNKQERTKAKVVEKKTERHEAPAPDDHASNYSDDLDTDDLASFLNNWEDASSDAGLRSPSRLYAPEKLNPGRKSQRSSKAAQAASQRASSDVAVAVELPKLKSQYGVDAWKRWIQWRETQPNLEKPRFGSRPIELKEDVLQCTTAELSYGLCCFINEVKRPNGELYSPDSLFYLCLGIQKARPAPNYLFEKGRVENIFMDRFYNKFSTDFTTILRSFKPSITTSYVHSRVEEEFLWDCKQLGAYSPIVLLNTLIFFCCKYFGFTTAEQHRQLSFAHVMRCTKTNPDSTKTTFLRFYPPISVTEAEQADPEVPAKKRKEEESKEEILEMTENTENPLRCPVRLYEFYLSKCCIELPLFHDPGLKSKLSAAAVLDIHTCPPSSSESVKQRTNLFYLLPERCCVPNSPLWFSSADLDDGTLDAMLIRILTVRELHLKKRKGEETEQTTPSDPPFIPEEEEEEEEDGDSE
ncbi:hypothetical protein F2P81_023068 [Scophthalmus maximus]|uniref:TRASH domain-containing protein n=1 Tax=Scophthalmus maximus TaxID=52904 RepID=A0A6A4RNZ2_SCOMX|nr:hypothetical protein F2P81_023068 [Scophthalmus maximus]